MATLGCRSATPRLRAMALSNGNSAYPNERTLEEEATLLTTCGISSSKNARRRFSTEIVQTNAERDAVAGDATAVKTLLTALQNQPTLEGHA